MPKSQSNSRLSKKGGTRTIVPMTPATEAAEFGYGATPIGTSERQRGGRKKSTGGGDILLDGDMGGGQAQMRGARTSPMSRIPGMYCVEKIKSPIYQVMGTRRLCSLGAGVGRKECTLWGGDWQ